MSAGTTHTMGPPDPSGTQPKTTITTTKMNAANSSIDNRHGSIPESTVNKNETLAGG